jgi:predicted ATPase with chaperone activity
MSATATLGGNSLETASSLISALGLDDSFQPQEPTSAKDTGLSEALIEDLVLKYLSGIGSASGRSISDNVALPMAILEDRLTAMRQRQEIAPSGSAMLGDHIYRLTDTGRDRAHRALRECAYVGPAPVPLDDYISSVSAQSISQERPRKTQLEKAFSDIHVEPEMLCQLGPAITAAKGMFVYGPPGNGKTTIAQRITRCFGQNILIPHAITEGGKIIKMFDASCHKPVRTVTESLFRTAEFDRRWIRIERPTVVVGGELTMDSLELKHDPISNVSEASLQLKSNCGCLLIDDFGRQRINPTELLNRWIIPLENRIDYLSLSNGRKIEVPFEQLIIFSTNLEPHDLADDAFLRRIPFKVEVCDPSLVEFHLLFQIFAKKLKVECPPAMVDYLVQTHYHGAKRPMRRCHARDLMEQIIYFCAYNEVPAVVNEANLDRAVKNYFTAMKGE